MACVHAEDGVGRNDKGAQIERSAVFAGHPVGVHGDNGLESLEVDVFGDVRDAHAGGGVVHTRDVLRRPEQLDRAFGRAIGFQAFEYLLRIVQHVRAGHELDGSIGHDTGIMPALALVVIHEEHVVGENLAEAELVGRGLCFGGGGSCYFNFFHFIDPSLRVSAGTPRLSLARRLPQILCYHVL